MFKIHKPFLKTVAVGLGWVCLLPSALKAQDHVVPLNELHRRAVAAAEARRADLAAADKFFSSEGVRRALQKGKIDSRQVRQAVSLLSDDELSELAAKAKQIDQDFAAGALTNQQLTYAVIALATAVFILVIIAA